MEKLVMCPGRIIETEFYMSGCPYMRVVSSMAGHIYRLSARD